MRVLVTGVSKGLGKFLHRHYQCDGLTRGQPLPSLYYDTIIHCAHDRENPQANLDMLQRLFSVPCGRFVYFSSVDVHNAFSLDNLGAGLAKLRCEQFIRTAYDNHLILRCGTLLGPYSRENTIIKALKGLPLSVTPDSTFGVVHHASLIPFIEKMGGTMTVAGDPKPIRDILEELGIACPEYGSYPYHIPPVAPTHDTMEEIQEFIEQNFSAEGDLL